MVNKKNITWEIIMMIPQNFKTSVGGIRRSPKTKKKKTQRR